MDLPPNQEYIRSADIPFGSMTDFLLNLLKYTKTENIFKIQASGEDETILMVYCPDNKEIWHVNEPTNPEPVNYKIEKIPLSRGITTIVSGNSIQKIAKEIDNSIYEYIKILSEVIMIADECDTINEIRETVQMVRTHIRKTTGSASGNCIFYGNKNYESQLQFPLTLTRCLDWLGNSILLMESSGTCDSSLVLVPKDFKMENGKIDFTFSLIPNNIMKYFKLITVTHIEKKDPFDEETKKEYNNGES